MEKGNFNYKVERENGNYDTIEFYIMLSNFTDEKLEEILEVLSIFKLIKMSRNRGFTDIYICELNEDININPIMSIISKYKLTEKDYGLYIDITSIYSNNDLYCPTGIAKIYQKLGGFIYIANGS